MQVAVTGAAGKTGSAVRRALGATEADVVPLVHRPRGLDNEQVADLGDAAQIRDALEGIDALYLIAPNVHPDEPGLLAPTLAECEHRGVRVVYHSVMHPYSPLMPHHLDKARVEDSLHRSDLSWTILQPASYADNALAPLRAVGDDGSWWVPYDVERPFTPIALEELAQIAARVLTEPDHDHATYELAGPQRITTAQMAAAAAEITGRPIEARADREHWRRGPGASLDADARDRLERMFDYYDAHGFCGGSAIAEMLLRRTPLTFTKWLAAARAGGLADD
ncbi:NAD(P)H-binding protein [Epidermidibacterium keratini]|uniref:NAD(P)H-binding protein n=1 Tax=Epidermidibacterium keratini TaxID=1891644 RepID=A0A7L4YJ95_9ACTN|nr:NAD(P)H-binding protein [Epidermidibacterium keratini]QHB98992.1 NAD(P)H-binding protein [Epidermidibacterium keratini]